MKGFEYVLSSQSQSLAGRRPDGGCFRGYFAGRGQWRVGQAHGGRRYRPGRHLCGKLSRPSDVRRHTAAQHGQHDGQKPARQVERRGGEQGRQMVVRPRLQGLRRPRHRRRQDLRRHQQHEAARQEVHDKDGKPIDMGVIMAFDEPDGKFLWQNAYFKLAAGRVQDWPARRHLLHAARGRRPHVLCQQPLRGRVQRHRPARKSGSST